MRGADPHSVHSLESSSAEPNRDPPKPSQPAGNTYCCRTLNFWSGLLYSIIMAKADYMAGPVLSIGDTGVSKYRHHPCPHEAYTLMTKGL